VTVRTRFITGNIKLQFGAGSAGGAFLEATAEQNIDYERSGEGQASGHDDHVGRHSGDEVARGYPPPTAEELDRPHDERDAPEDGQRDPEDSRAPGRAYLSPDPLYHEPEGDEAHPCPYPRQERSLVGQVLPRLGPSGPPFGTHRAVTRTLCQELFM
jgi:hypothetical protein